MLKVKSIDQFADKKQPIIHLRSFAELYGRHTCFWTVKRRRKIWTKTLLFQR